MNLRSFLLAILLAPAIASATTYQVGPGRALTQLTQIAGTLAAGDIVEVDGNATYNPVVLNNSGTLAAPITIRGMASGASRPTISGGTSALRINGSHYVFEDLQVTNGSTFCVFMAGQNLTLRRMKVHTCPQQGILGADEFVGDILITEVEVTNQGNSTTPNDLHHPIYIATDGTLYPNAVLRIEKSWIHDNFSGNGIKSRAKTVKVMYNWIEITGSGSHAVEMDGPDPGGATWTCPVPNGSNDANLCTGEIIGNVLIQRGTRALMLRLGGDGTGDSNGRYHVVNNTMILNSAYTDGAPVVRAFGTLQSIEMHNNIIWAQNNVGLRIVRDAEATWVSGRRVTGTRNLITGSSATYSGGIYAQAIQGLTNTIFVANTAPIFVNSNVGSPSTLDLRLQATSPARRAGNAGSTTTAGYQVVSPTNLPSLQPPRIRPDPPNFTATNRPQPTDDAGTPLPGEISLGAYEYTTASSGTARISIAKGGTGAGTVTSVPAGINCGVTCFVDVAGGTPVTLTAVASAGSVFTGWSGGGCTGNSTCLVTPSSNVSVTANFATLAVTPLLLTNNTGTDFGGQSVQTTSLAHTVYLTNGGTGTITVSNASSNNPMFAVTNGCTNIGSGETCPVTVRFTPTNTTPQNATLTVNTTAGNPTFPMTGTGELSLVTHFYQAILNREPDASGKSFWQGEATRMSGLGANINETWFVMAGYFFNSAEYLAANKSTNAFVTDLYNTFFNRGPDSGGLNFWVGQINSGLPREVVLFSFMFSPEFATFTQGIFGNTAARPEVNVVMDFFRGILNRLPDTSSFQYWLGRLRTAQCSGANAVYAEIDAMSSAFIFNPEYNNRQRNNTQFVTDMYYSFLRRGGDLAGVQFWINQLNTGAKTTNTVRSDFIGTPEFGTRVQAVINAGCVQ